MKIRTICILTMLCTGVLLSGGAAAADIILKTKSGDTITAIYSAPEGGGKFPAVIYNHGTYVRKLGHYEAAERGYNVDAFVKELNRQGYAAIAPIRKVGRLHSVTRLEKGDIMGGPPGEWNRSVAQGLEAIDSSLDFLKDQPNVDSERIGIIGFSEGGNITLWSALEHKEFKAIVLMSPASLKKSDEYKFTKAVPELNKISAPVLLTLGSRDLRPIIRDCKSSFIPAMEKLNKDFEYRTDYPGDHKWFWRVRSEYWHDVLTFLNRKLK